MTNERRVLDWAVVLATTVALFGIIARQGMIAWGMNTPFRNNIFNYLFAREEQPFLILLGCASLAIGLVLVVVVRRDGVAPYVSGPPIPSARTTAMVALVVLVATLAIGHFVLHDYLFSMDEYSADFQARIFARGQATAEIPQPWRSLGLALTPTFVYFDPATGRWASQYLPGYALLKAPFVLLGVGTLLNPILAALAVLCTAGAARRVWPDEGLRPWVAITLLVTSSQFVLTSGSGYSMPAHLALNLLWLWLYLRGDRRSWIGALLVGVLALELHSPFPHALFVAPFLLRLLRERRWARLGSAVVVYGLASVAGLLYLREVHPHEIANGGFTTLFAWPTMHTVYMHGVNLSVLLTWQAPVVAVLTIAALLRPWRLPPVLADLALGLVGTLFFFMFFPLNQGHGWGYRYAYQVLGNLVLLAAAGVPVLQSVLGDRRTRAVLAFGVVTALVVQLPLRFVRIERFVRPFAAANALVQSRAERIVVVHGESIWYGADLVRNDPFMRGAPAVLRAQLLAPGTVDEIRRVLPNQVIDLPDEEIAAVGALRSASRLRPRSTASSTH